MTISPASHPALSPGTRLEAARVALATRAQRRAPAGESPPTLEYRVAQVQAKLQCVAALGAGAARHEGSLDVIG